MTPDHLVSAAYKRSVDHIRSRTFHQLPAGLFSVTLSFRHTMRLPIYGVATAVCVIASVLAQDNQSSSNTNAVTEQPQSSQSQTQAASSSAANSNSQSQASSGSNSQSSASVTSAPPVTSVYSTAFETYSVSIDQALTGTPIILLISSLSHSRSPTARPSPTLLAATYAS
jgi:hypothetical protein